MGVPRAGFGRAARDWENARVRVGEPDWPAGMGGARVTGESGCRVEKILVWADPGLVGCGYIGNTVNISVIR